MGFGDDLDILFPRVECYRTDDCLSVGFSPLSLRVSARQPTAGVYKGLFVR